MKFTEEEIYGELTPTKTQEKNVKELVRRLNIIGEAFSDPVFVVAGLRTEEKNFAVGGIPNSPHLTGEAVDLKDEDYKLSKFLLNNIELLERVGLYMENPFCCTSKTITKTWNGRVFMNNWIHLQTRKASSTIFNP
jgi:uncharacterized protein YcbK (DUF882 family)